MSRRSQCCQGAVLLEVLLAIGLLAVVTGCLLSAFQQVRRIERQLTESIGSLEQSSRLVEFLRRDLLNTRLILQEEEDLGGWSLTLLTVSSEASASAARGISVVRYLWNASDSCLVRTVEVPRRMPISVTMIRGKPIEFEVIRSSSGIPEGVQGITGQHAARAVHIRTEIDADSTQSSLLGGLTPKREIAIVLPIPIPVAAAREMRL